MSTFKKRKKKRRRKSKMDQIIHQKVTPYLRCNQGNSNKFSSKRLNQKNLKDLLVKVQLIINLKRHKATNKILNCFSLQNNNQ